MQNNQTISIVIPLYNKGKAIERGLKSILAQTYPYWECEIVDDGSTDDSAVYVKKYTCDERIHYHYKDNGGVSSARNFGVREAKGEYIIFLDADDVFLPNAFEILIKTIEKYGTKVAVGTYIIDRKRKFNLPCSTKLKSSVLRNNFRALYVDLVIPRMGATLFKKEVVQKYPCNEFLSRFEDAEQQLDIMRETKIAYTSKPVMIYTQDLLGLSNNFNAKKDFSSQVVFENKSFWERMMLASLLNRAMTTYPNCNLPKKYAKWMMYVYIHRILSKLLDIRRKSIRILQCIIMLSTRAKQNKLYAYILKQ